MKIFYNIKSLYGLLIINSLKMITYGDHLLLKTNDLYKSLYNIP